MKLAAAAFVGIEDLSGRKCNAFLHRALKDLPAVNAILAILKTAPEIEAASWYGKGYPTMQMTIQSCDHLIAPLPMLHLQSGEMIFDQAAHLSSLRSGLPLPYTSASSEEQPPLPSMPLLKPALLLRVHCSVGWRCGMATIWR